MQQLKKDLEDKIKALEIILSEKTELKTQLEQMTIRAKSAEIEHKTLVDRMMLEKMKNAEQLNEANQLYDDMIKQLKASGLEKLARQQIDGIVRQSEEGADAFLQSIVPSTFKHRLQAHEGGCAAILFECNSNKLITGGTGSSSQSVGC